MVHAAPELPPHGGYIRAVRESSRTVREWANITVSGDAIARLLHSPAFTTTFDRLRKAHGMAFPLAFPSVLSEVNLLSILALLNFASGYRTPLHAATGRGAFDNVRALVFALYISSAAGTGEGDYLSARGMRAIRAATVADLMGVAGKIHVEREHESLRGVTVGQLGGPVWEVVELVTRTLNETGGVLVDAGYPDLGSLVMQALKEGEKARRDGPGAECDVILERLVRVVPAFRDMALVDGQPVYCFKKALLTIHAIALRFGSADPAPFSVPRTENLPIFADNVIPSMLVHLGVIDLSTSTPALGLASLFPDAGKSETLEALLEAAPEAVGDTKGPKPKEVPKEGPVLSVEQAYILRAAAIDACELIVQAARELGASAGEHASLYTTVTVPELDAWIWAVAKDRADYRKLERFVLKNTPFF
ncbi:hypothetical protein WOLCODRAFT_133053 [Wolfiporia cocos MD-104 SS10]|uniref:Queuosine 5'-phosphate N-glycosylase/hydrolase n=1 Tax=Wolfiporia cocos (strain MD-104) TaxID=742152 RepID=A0A2H3JP61_WOLCO|nr:hypothetical protein WOLCODRAFT_133053 [Wolfiporia cocos MD-104 SS10]